MSLNPTQSKQFQYDELSNQMNDQRNTTFSVKNNVTYRNIDMINNSESQHNNTDEEAIDLDENGTQSDDIENLSNSINIFSIKNSENIENAKECGKEISYNIYDGTKLSKIREFPEYQASGSPHWQQVQIILKGGNHREN